MCRDVDGDEDDDDKYNDNDDETILLFLFSEYLLFYVTTLRIRFT